MSGQQFSADRIALIDQFRSLSALATSLEALQRSVVETMAKRLTHFNWTGFYMLDPNDPAMLVLGPFVGAPTPHVRIPVAQGICGAAGRGRRDSNRRRCGRRSRYLSCSIETKSEIVVPVYAHGNVVGEIDIDSHAPAAFKHEDRVFLEEVARIVGQYIEGHPAESPVPLSK